MNTQGLIKSPLEDVLINKLLLSHDPDGRCLDSDQLLHAMENIMLYATTISQVPDTDFGNFVSGKTNIEVIGFEKSLTQTIIKISHEMSCNCLEDQATSILHDKTMSLFDLLANYRWDDKAVLALSAFAKSYGEFWLLMQLYPKNPLAVSVTMLKQLPSDVRALSRQFKSLGSLMKTVVDLTKSVIEFERLPLSQVKLASEAYSTRELHIYSAVYWIVRSILTCSNQITDLKAMKPEQYSDSTTIATWELSSLVHRLKGMSNHLKKQVQECSEKSEAKLYQSLLNIFKEEHKENQQVLRMLFAFRDDFPLIDCLSRAKIGLQELKNKVVVLLVSRPELLPIEDSLLLIQQHNRSIETIYEIVWIPIPVSGSWTDSEKKSFRLIMSRSLPWLSIKLPWSLNSAAVTFIKQAWNYKDDPLMVVLDSNGNVTNFNAMDMVFIWGPRAYPFSASREEELWLEQKWTLQFLVDEIDPLLTKWVEEERYICLYGSNNMDWIIELNSKAKEIKDLGFELEMIYVGKKKKKTSEHAINDNILAKIVGGDLRSPLSLTKMQFFWLRLESMQRSKLRRLGFVVEAGEDRILQEVSRLIDMDDKGEDWAVIGKGCSERIARVEDSNKLMDCIDKYILASELGNFSLVDGEPCCGHSRVITREDEEKIQATGELLACEKCGHIMNKFFIYK